jgi:membrane-associated protease RseP (regulator of RpoE activity)
VRDPLEGAALEVRQVLFGVGAFVAAAVALAVVNPTLAATVGVLFFFFVVMIGLHELGHFVMAKRAGMKVTEFFIGFGPRLWSVQRGETEYGIKALPLGGYCKIVGMTNLEDIDPVDEARTYRAKGWGAKVSTVVAGPVTHFALAIIFVYAILVGEGDGHRVEATTTIDEVTATIDTLDAQGNPTGELPSAAAEAGLRSGDRILAVDGKTVRKWDDMTDDFRRRAGDTIVLTIERGGEARDLPLTLMTVYRDDAANLIALDPFDGAEKSGFAGLSPVPAVPSVGVFEGLYLAPVRSFQGGVDTVSALGHMFSPSGIGEYFDNFTDDTASSARPGNARFISPIGFGKVANDAVEAGWTSVFALLASINLFVGILNLLPLLPFDGGHIAVASYESIASKVRRRRVRVDFARLLPVMVATLSVLAFIFVSALFLDIARPLESSF